MPVWHQPDIDMTNDPLLQGKKIILGISGGIAAYKAAYLVRLFKQAGAEVKVTGTRNAFAFITKVTLESLSQNKVYDEVFGQANDYTTEHVALTDWGDVFVVAPATANIIGKYASGIADDALSTSLLAFDKAVFLAPAMNVKMYAHFSVQKNLSALKQHGVHIIEPAEGFLACGYEGKGRMEEPGEIFRMVSSYLKYREKTLAGKHVMVTAGPTMEDIDPVRFVGNHSSGQMGYSLAQELIDRGANVTLVSGPANLPPIPGANLVKVRTATEMYDACMQVYPEVDAVIMAAAVADYSPAKQSKKIKKEQSGDAINITLFPTKDILKAMGERKGKQVLAGFALETDNEEENAIKKLQSKNLDFIVLNSPNDPGSGFMHPTNKITIIDNKLEIFRYPLKNKQDVAVDIADTLEKHLDV